MKKLALIGVIALTACAIGCGHNDDKTVVTDADLKKEIETQLNSDPELSAANLAITTDAASNAATISGTVESAEVRTKVVDLARSARSGLVIEDNITVKPRVLPRAEFTREHARQERAQAKELKERIGSSINDAWIHATIVTTLIRDSNTQERKINVDVDNGVVTLRGTVDSADQKAEAERISKETEGVKRVKSLLKVAKAS